MARTEEVWQGTGRTEGDGHCPGRTERVGQGTGRTERDGQGTGRTERDGRTVRVAAVSSPHCTVHLLRVCIVFVRPSHQLPLSRYAMRGVLEATTPPIPSIWRVGTNLSGNCCVQSLTTGQTHLVKYIIILEIGNESIPKVHADDTYMIPLCGIESS